MDKNCPFFEKNKNTFENRELFDISRFLYNLSIKNKY